ncbi:SIS domain-containing protein [Ekhidna sp.]|uniref:SIS domain-containing protein n=1 Tax=Ekhidna sp. TaxID=2608089 RepID=UPI003CCBAAE4
MENIYTSYIKKLTEQITKLDFQEIDRLRVLIDSTRSKGNTIYIFGNGGSGANSSHIAGDYLKSLNNGQKNRIRIICLNDNFPAIGAIANDIDYNDIFKNQLSALIKPGDLVIGLSGSGKSKNVVRALKCANQMSATTVGLVGFDGGEVLKIANLCLHIQIPDMEIVEDIHMMIFHMLKKSLLAGKEYTYI